MTESELEFPADIAAAYVTIDDGPRHEPALIDFSGKRLVISRDGVPDLRIDASTLRVRAGNHTMRLETNTSRIDLEFRTTAATNAAHTGGQVALLGLAAAASGVAVGAAALAPAAKVRADGVQLRALSDLRFPQFFRYLEKNAQSVEDTPSRRVQQALIGPIRVISGLYLIVFLPLVIFFIWVAFAIVMPFVATGRTIWTDGFDLDDLLLVPLTTSLTMLGSLVVASAIPWGAILGLRLIHQAFASRAHLVETFTYEAPLLARPYMRFRPAWMHIAMTIALISFAADDARRDQDRIGFIIFGVITVGVALASIAEAAKLTGFRRATRVGWLDEYGTAENAFWHASNRRPIALTIAAGSVLHLTALAIIG